MQDPGRRDPLPHAERGLRTTAVNGSRRADAHDLPSGSASDRRIEGTDQHVNDDKGSPDDHGKFSLNEDWTATIVGLVILTVCLFGFISPDLIP